MRNLFTAISMLLQLVCFSQQITYSQTQNPDSITINFSVIGKVGNNILVYDRTRGKHTIDVYDDKMQLRNSSELDFLHAKKLTYLNFIPYQHFCLSIFQVLENNIFYCKVAKVDDTGKLMEIKTIDSARSDIFLGGETYSVSVSENKRYILFNRPLVGLKKDALQMDQVILNEDLTIKKNEHYFIPFSVGKQFVSAASIDNAANVVFMSWEKEKNKKSAAAFYRSPADGSDLEIRDLFINKYELSNPQIKINNKKSTYYLISFYKASGGNTLGLFSMSLKSDLSDDIPPKITPFTKEEKKLARLTVPLSWSINNYELNDIVLKSDGGFVVTASVNRNFGFSEPKRRYIPGEVASTTYNGSTSAGNTDYSYYNYISDTRLPGTISSVPLEPSLYVWNNAASQSPVSSNNFTTYSAGYVGYPKGNVLTFSFDRTGHSIATNSLSDQLPTALLTSYSVSVLNDQVMFIYNNEANDILTMRSFSVFTDGSTMLNPQFRNFNSEYTFFPSQAKQVDERTIVVPCIKDHHMAIAKITW